MSRGGNKEEHIRTLHFEEPRLIAPSYIPVVQERVCSSLHETHDRDGDSETGFA